MIKVYSNFASLFSVMSPLYLFISNLYTLHKKSLLKWNFQTFEWSSENSPNSLSCLKLQVSFSLNFSSLFSVLRNSSVLFKLKLYMIWTINGLLAHQSAKFQTFHCSCKISLNLYFHSLLLFKVHKILVKKSTEELCLMTLKIDAKFEEKLMF